MNGAWFILFINFVLYAFFDDDEELFWVGIKDEVLVETVLYVFVASFKHLDAEENEEIGELMLMGRVKTDLFWAKKVNTGIEYLCFVEYILDKCLSLFVWVHEYFDEECECFEYNLEFVCFSRFGEFFDSEDDELDYFSKEVCEFDFAYFFGLWVERDFFYWVDSFD